jgi:hypothetical protein
MNDDRHWLNRKRIVVYPRLFVTIFVLTSIGWLLLSKHMIDPGGKPLGYDFITYYAASKLALAGHAADAYSLPLIFQAEKLIVPANDKMFAWYYPPAFYLLVLPLALLPYLVAYASFVLATLAGYVFVFRRILKDNTAMWCLAAFSGLWINLLHGQNAFLTAAFAASALICLPRRPVLAGVFIGLLAVKPHLALLFPVALIAIGAWRAIAAAIVTAASFTALGTAVLGVATLKAGVASLANARIFLEGGNLPWVKMPTVFALLRLWGVPIHTAYFFHIAVAILAVAIVWHLWRHSPDWGLRSAALMTATFLVSPYLFDYDLAWLAFPIAWLVVIGVRDGWLPGEREVLVAAWLLPFLMAPIAKVIVIQPGPFVLGAMLWIMLQRANTKVGMMTPALIDLQLRRPSAVALPAS